MSKELEALDRLIAVGDPSKYWNSNYFVEDVNIVKQALQRLEAIDNAKPSEALEYIENKLKDLEYVAKQNDNEYLLSKYIPSEKFDTIKQALLKAQESKKYLKWEDLDFSFKEKYMKVKLNGNIYTLRYTRIGVMEFPVAHLEFNNTEITIIDCKKQFFNDLHLEVLNNE